MKHTGNPVLSERKGDNPATLAAFITVFGGRIFDFVYYCLPKKLVLAHSSITVFCGISSKVIQQAVFENFVILVVLPTPLDIRARVVSLVQRVSAFTLMVC